MADMAAGAYFSAKALSEPVPVQQMIEGWQQAGVGEQAQAKARAGVAFKWDKPLAGGVVLNDVGVEKRWDYYLAFTRDTARFYSRLESQTLDVGRYPLDLDVNALESRALYATFSQVYGAARWSLRVNGLKAQTLQYGSLKGEGEVLASGEYSFEYDLDYQYSHDHLLNRSGNLGGGYGYSLDAQFEFRFASGLGLTAAVEDGVHRIFWQDVSRSEGCLFRQREQLNVCQQNFVQDSQRDFVQTLPAEYQLRLDYQSVYVALHEWNGQYFFPVAWRYKNVTAQYDSIQQVVGVSWSRGEYALLSLGLDNPNPAQAKVWQLALKYFWI